MKTFFIVLAGLLVLMYALNRRKRKKLIAEVKDEFPVDTEKMLKLRDNIFAAYEKGHRSYLVIDKLERETLVSYKINHRLHYKKLEETLGLKIDDGLDLKKVF